jgi:15-cis-phytoene synthase/lycopene beta-cyclase
LFYFNKPILPRTVLIFIYSRYSFCRITDDLVDEAPDRATARTLIDQSRQLLDFKFASSGPGLLNSVKAQNEKHTKNQYIPQSLISAVERLPSTRLNSHHLHGLLQGFVTDLEFDAEKGSFPIATEEHLESYALHVAGTVAASVLELVLSHYPEHISAKDHALRQRVVAAGKGMGQALQYVNIARDIERDALIQRVYLPATWLYKEGLTPADVIAEPCNPKILLPKQRMLDKADECARAAEGAIAYLPTGIQGPVRATVESYMAIGTELRKPGIHCLRGGKIKLPLWRRLYVAYSAMARSQVAA